jgi:hypothetical protein
LWAKKVQISLMCKKAANPAAAAQAMICACQVMMRAKSEHNSTHCSAPPAWQRGVYHNRRSKTRWCSQIGPMPGAPAD